MRFLRLAGLGMVALSLALPPLQASASSSFLNCVQYVRQAGKIDLAGNAWMWWGNAKGRYATGHLPSRDSVMVFQRTKAMPSGHVALVRQVLDQRTVVIEHANWAPRDGAKGRVSRDLVQDVSPANDWTAVRVRYRPSMSFGKIYATSGFISPTPHEVLQDVASMIEP
jgi:hypothetical protein